MRHSLIAASSLRTIGLIFTTKFEVNPSNKVFGLICARTVIDVFCRSFASSNCLHSVYISGIHTRMCSVLSVALVIILCVCIASLMEIFEYRNISYWELTQRSALLALLTVLFVKYLVFLSVSVCCVEDYAYKSLTAVSYRSTTDTWGEGGDCLQEGIRP